MQKRYIVRLTEEEREICRDVIRRLKGSSERVRRAQVLLQADADGPGWTDRAIAAGVFVPREDGGEYSPALRAGGVRQGAGTQAARHATDAEDSRRRVRGADHRLASGATAEGVRELEFAVAGASGGRAGDCRVGEPRNAATDAKKNGMCQRKIAYWVIPPDADAEFAAHMEEVLETYARPLDCDCPVLCMDEQPVQLIRETRTPMPATPQSPAPGRLRIRTCRYGVGVHVLRAVVGMAASHGPPTPHEKRLGRGGRQAARGPVRSVLPGRCGLRQPQHAHQRRFLRTV